MPAWHHFLCFHQYRFFSNSTWEAFFWAQFCSSDKLIWCHLLLIVYFLSLLLPFHPKPTKFKTVECIFRDGGRSKNLGAHYFVIDWLLLILFPFSIKMEKNCGGWSRATSTGPFSSDGPAYWVLVFPVTILIKYVGHVLEFI